MCPLRRESAATQRILGRRVVARGLARRERRQVDAAPHRVHLLERRGVGERSHLAAREVADADDRRRVGDLRGQLVGFDVEQLGRAVDRDAPRPRRVGPGAVRVRARQQRDVGGHVGVVDVDVVDARARASSPRAGSPRRNRRAATGGRARPRAPFEAPARRSRSTPADAGAHAHGPRRSRHGDGGTITQVRSSSWRSACESASPAGTWRIDAVSTRTPVCRSARTSPVTNVCVTLGYLLTR